MGNKLKIFFHYHPNDEKHFSDIFKQLPRSIRKETICEILHPGSISAGQDRKKTYQSWIDSCALFIPISTSDYWGTDLGEAEYIPIHDQALEKSDKLATMPIIFNLTSMPMKSMRIYRYFLLIENQLVLLPMNMPVKKFGNK